MKNYIILPVIYRSLEQTIKHKEYESNKDKGFGYDYEREYSYDYEWEKFKGNIKKRIVLRREDIIQIAEAYVEDFCKLTVKSSITDTDVYTIPMSLDTLLERIKT